MRTIPGSFNRSDRQVRIDGGYGCGPTYSKFQVGGYARRPSTSPPNPLSKKEGELAINLTLITIILELEASSPSFLERGLGGEVDGRRAYPPTWNLL